jgi:hypothetical protein
MDIHTTVFVVPYLSNLKIPFHRGKSITNKTDSSQVEYATISTTSSKTRSLVKNLSTTSLTSTATSWRIVCSVKGLTRKAERKSYASTMQQRNKTVHSTTT